MKESRYWFAGAAAVATVLLAWFAGRWLRLSGADLWVLRLGTATLGLSVIGAFLWPQIRAASAGRKNSAEAKAAGSGSGDAASSGDIGSLVHEAESSAGRKLADTSVVLVLDASSAMGSTGLVENSGLNAEPLASVTGGKAWIAQNTIFLELKSQMYSDPKALGVLTRSLGSRQFRYIFGKAVQPSRAAVLGLPTKNFLDREKGNEAKTRAQELRARLREISRVLGIRLPVYVAFTGLEDVSHFKEYAIHLPSEVIVDPFGVSLREELAIAGVWAEQQSKRISRGLRQLFEFLSARRLDILSEEEVHDRRRGAYLFPREFRRLSRMGPLSDFLLEVSRPHQLGSSPYLRGFFFLGAYETLRPRSAPQPSGESSSSGLSGNFGLSGVLKGDRFEHSFVSRPAPKQIEWVFLQRLFGEAILPDLANLGATFVSRGANVGRRVLLGTAAAVLLLWAGAMTVSYTHNRALETRAAELSIELRNSTLTPQQPVAMPQLRQLESLRAVLGDLRQYRMDGHPWYLGVGLYTGNELYPRVRKSYFDQFERFMLTPAQNVLRSHLSSLGPSSTATAGFDSIYESLKAYLITRSHPDKSYREFLSPVLLRCWQAQQGMDSERTKLAKAQFDFYSEEWRKNPPYPTRNDDAAITSGRKFLQDNFGGVDQVYSLMKADASKANPAIVFSGADVIVNTPKIPGTFSKPGWATMQKLLHDPGHWSADDWVVKMPDQNTAKVAGELPARYRAEYIKQWAEFLGNSKVVCCRTRTAADTAKRLGLLSEATESPLLRLFCVASQNTDVDAPEIKSVFQPVRAVVPPNCDRQYTSEVNAGYLSALFGLQQRLNDLSKGPPGADARSAAASQIESARTAAHDLASKFQVDNQWQIHKTMTRLLNEPISGAESCLPGLEVGPVCAQFNTTLKSKYPFNRTASAQASIADVNTFFNPRTGLVTQILQQVLSNLVVEQGGRFVQSPLAPRPVRSDFLIFLNRSVQIRDALYPKGSQEPQMTFSLRITPSPVISSVIVKLGNQVQTFSGQDVGPKQFVWNGSTQGAEVNVLLPGGVYLSDLQFAGPWAIFEILDTMRVTTQGDSQLSFDWVLKERISDKEVHDQNGNAVKIRLDLFGDSAAMFRTENRAGLQCVAGITQ